MNSVSNSTNITRFNNEGMCATMPIAHHFSIPELFSILLPVGDNTMIFVQMHNMDKTSSQIDGFPLKIIKSMDSIAKCQILGNISSHIQRQEVILVFTFKIMSACKMCFKIQLF